MKRNVFIVRILAAGFVSLSPLAAQSGSGMTTGDASIIAWTGSYGAGPFKETVTGDMTADLAPDAVTLFGSTPVFQYKPALYTADMAVPVSASAIAMRPKIPGEDRDRLIVSTLSSGIVEYHLELNANLDGYNWVSTTIDSGTNWSNLKQVVVGDADGAGYEDIGALHSSGTVLLYLISDGAGGFTPFVPVPVSSQVHDFAMMDWDGDGIVETVAATDNGLEVIHWNGSILTSRTGGVPGGRVAVITEPGGERIAWSNYDNINNEETITVIGPNNSDRRVGIGNPGAISLEAADVDLDGYDELLVSGTASDHAILLMHQGPTGFPYLYDTADNTKTRFALIGTGELIGSQTRPALSDLSNDGVPDLFAPVEQEEHVRYRDGGNVFQVGTPSDPFLAAGFDIVSEGGQNVVQLSSKFDTTSSGGMQHLETVVWYDTTVEPIEPVYVDHCHRSITGDATFIGPTVPESDKYFTTRYFLDVRLATYDTNDELIAAGPSRAGYAISQSYPDYQQVSENLDELDYEWLIELEYGQPGFSGSAIGLFVSSPRISGFPQGEVPVTAPNLSQCEDVDETEFPQE